MARGEVEVPVLAPLGNLDSPFIRPLRLTQLKSRRKAARAAQESLGAATIPGKLGSLERVRVPKTKVDLAKVSKLGCGFILVALPPRYMRKLKAL